LGLDISKLRTETTTPYHLVETSDGVELFLRSWSQSSSEDSNVAVLILHGITAHSEPYAFFGEGLSENGFPTYGLDLRGHGLSDGNRGDSPSKERFAKDLCETVSFLKGMHSKVILLGHSLGVLSANIILNNCIAGVEGAILLSGARTVNPGVQASPSLSDKLKIVFNSIISPSKPVIAYYREGMLGLDDPLFNFKYTLRFIRMHKLEEFAFPEQLDILVFVGVGDQDELFSESAVKELFEEVPTDNKEFHIFEGAKHAEFPEDSWVPIANWLKKHFS